MDLVLFIMNGWFPMGLRIIHHYNVFRSVIFHHIYCFFSTAMLRRSQQWPHVSDLFSLHTIKHAFSCKHIYIYIATPFSPMSYFFCYIYILHIFIAGIYIHTYIYTHTYIWCIYAWTDSWHTPLCRPLWGHSETMSLLRDWPASPHFF
jgi:hypothetical protein